MFRNERNGKVGGHDGKGSHYNSRGKNYQYFALDLNS
jgi:hypothetical protein